MKVLTESVTNLTIREAVDYLQTNIAYRVSMLAGRSVWMSFWFKNDMVYEKNGQVMIEEGQNKLTIVLRDIKSVTVDNRKILLFKMRDGTEINVYCTK